MQKKEASIDPTLSNTDKAYRKLFYSQHPELLSLKESTDNNVLVLGPARSGTSWLSKVLSHADNVRVFFNEPLFHIHPPLPFGKSTNQTPYFLRDDHSSAPYTRYFSKEHALYCVYQSLLSPCFNGSKLLHEAERDIMQLNPQASGKILIKEVHALMASEALVSSWKGPIIMTTRNPVFAVDSLLHYRTPKAHMWRKEAQHICEDSFLQRFFPDKSVVIKSYFKQHIDDGQSRSNVIMSKVLTVAIINHMLHTLAKENKGVYFIQYEDLCRSPEVNFTQIAKFCKLQMGSTMKDFIRKSSTTDLINDPTPYSLLRNSADMLIRPLKFIKESELKNINSMLKTCDLENLSNF
ncbi:MAG: sulfotransferase domain-containing protein [Flavobacteriales bacterium]|nr:sulfotransferase domain-containing protein [Flavobacteriales bacterium]